LLNLTNLLSKVVAEKELPPEIDLEFYRLIHSDLSTFDDSALALHFERHGRSEGRIASAAAHRVGFIATVPKHAKLLEIGPFTTPAFRGPNVKYFDVHDRAGLIARARLIGYPTENCPNIDYVSPTGDLSVVHEKFEYIFSSHCIEHQPDLVSHLQIAARLLDPGGMYYLIIPDKRYCFDHFIPETTIDDVLAAYKERRTLHTEKNIYAARVLATHNNQADHWRGKHGDPAKENREARIQAAAREFKEGHGKYIDVHAWQFTPQNFRRIVTGTINEGLCNFRIERVYDTLFEELEFNVVLKRV